MENFRNFGEAGENGSTIPGIFGTRSLGTFGASRRLPGRTRLSLPFSREGAGHSEVPSGGEPSALSRVVPPEWALGPPGRGKVPGATCLWTGLQQSPRVR